MNYLSFIAGTVLVTVFFGFLFVGIYNIINEAKKKVKK
jgi:hypothetical protein